MSRPGVARVVVGLTADVEAEEEGLQARYVLKRAYAEAVRRAGGLPVVLPHLEDASEVEALKGRLDALVVTGGHFDVPPELYGEAARPGLGPLKAGRTGFELAILRRALDWGLPVLGVCGGMQLLNVAFGGTLHQDLLREVTGAQDHEQKSPRTLPDHPVAVQPGSRLERAVGRTQLEVNSTHHQAVARPGDGLVVTGVAPDGVVEALEAPGDRFVVGVQWHPELLVEAHPEHQGLYDALVAAAAGRDEAAQSAAAAGSAGSAAGPAAEG